ncbi:MAG: ABC transporter permease [Bacteroidota bacterium]
MNKQLKPPQRALRFLRWFCQDEYLEEIEGNLLELYEQQYEDSPAKARWQFVWNVLRHFRPAFIKSLSSPPLTSSAMFRNYFKVAWRNALKQKLYSFINLSGLTIGMSCFILIALYIQYELSYDTHHERADQTYRIYLKETGNAFRGTDLFAVSPEPLAPALRESFPEVQAAATIATGYRLLSYQDKAFSPRALYADENVFDVFTISMTAGVGAEALQEPNSVLLSESLVEKYFGDESPLGQELILANDRPLTVSGVFKGVPNNQHLQFEFITSLKNCPWEDDVGQWASNNYYTYVVLSEDADPKILEKKLTVFDEYVEPAYANFPFKPEFLLQPIQDIHFAADINFNPLPATDIRYIYLLACIAFIILLLAAINYTNLATSRSVKRSKEVGMRKVLGARKTQLVIQLLSESFLLTSISFILALGLAYLLLPFFENLMDQPIPFSIVGSRWLLVSMLSLALLIGGLSGLYPAFFLSAVSPVKAFKGSFLKRFSQGTVLRNGLIIGQFTAAIVLAISSVVVYQQLEYIQNKKLGFNREQVVYVPFNFEKIDENTEVIRNELLAHSNIEKVSKSIELPLNSSNQGIVDKWEGNDGQREFFCYRNYVDYDYLDLFEIELLAGRNFSSDYATDSIDSYILNKSAVKAIGWTPESAIGKGFREGQVVGVVKDFHFQPMDLSIEPLWMMLRLENNYGSNGNISIKVSTDDLENTLAYVQQTFKSIAPSVPFEYHFLDESYNQLYQAEQRLGQAFTIFTMLALLIACIGLFGLVSYNVVQRTKEIGIRKVLGASVLAIVELLSKDFLKLVVVALVLATPIAWYAMQQWLNDFAYRIDIPWWVFILVAMFAIGISVLTVSFQSIRAALANPVDSLRNE